MIIHDFHQLISVIVNGLYISMLRFWNIFLFEQPSEPHMKSCMMQFCQERTMKVHVVDYDKQQCKECNCDGDMGRNSCIFLRLIQRELSNIKIRRRLE